MDTKLLLKNASLLENKTVLELSESLKVSQPSCQKNGKGYIGGLVENFLGATAQNKPIPDFPSLGIELKTIPLLPKSLKPKESTYVTKVPPIRELLFCSWKESSVFLKLAHVLWVPYATTLEKNFRNYQFLKPFLWSMNDEDEQTLYLDWTELVEYIELGLNINASIGQALHVRPKARNSLIYTQRVDEYGFISSSTPKGFYLRQSFTEAIIRKHL